MRTTGYHMAKFDGLDQSEKTIAILGDRWWPNEAQEQGDKICKRFLCEVWQTRKERQNVNGASCRSRNGALSRKGCVVNGHMGHMTKASEK